MRLTYGDPFRIVNVALRAMGKPLILIDCWSLYSAILRIQKRSQYKCAKLIRNYIRGLQELIATSYIDAPYNLPDAETKHACPTNMIPDFVVAGRLRLSFDGRRIIQSKKDNKPNNSTARDELNGQKGLNRGRE